MYCRKVLGQSEKGAKLFSDVRTEGSASPNYCNFPKLTPQSHSHGCFLQWLSRCAHRCKDRQSSKCFTNSHFLSMFTAPISSKKWLVLVVMETWDRPTSRKRWCVMESAPFYRWTDFSYTFIHIQFPRFMQELPFQSVGGSHIGLRKIYQERSTQHWGNMFISDFKHMTIYIEIVIGHCYHPSRPYSPLQPSVTLM